MPISWRRWFRHRSFRRGKKSLRGGIIEQCGKFTYVNACFLIHHILQPISIGWNGPPIGPFEEPAVPIITLDAKPRFMDEAMML